MGYTAVIQARKAAETRSGTLKEAIKLSEERAQKAETSARDSSHQAQQKNER